MDEQRNPDEFLAEIRDALRQIAADSKKVGDFCDWQSRLQRRALIVLPLAMLAGCLPLAVLLILALLNAK